MNVFLETVGCRLNQSEIERMANQLRVAGHVIVADAQEADVVVINTCAVTAEAVADSRQKVRQAYRKGVEEIYVTGCWATLDATAAKLLPGVRRVIPNQQKENLTLTLLNPIQAASSAMSVRHPLPGARARTRAFIKVQDGCDNHCTFCVTRLARGSSHSRSVHEVLSDIRSALAGGVKEVVLTGVNLGSWGRDLTPRASLRSLIETILVETETPRLRLSSLEPWDVDESFFNLWRDARLCRQLHLPLQSGCAETLRRMARKTTPDAFARLVDRTRASLPQIAITTDILVGFPGETELEFARSLSFVEEVSFADGHVFSFSPRPGTPAARYPDQIPRQERKSRNARMRAALHESALRYRRGFIGQELEVLWETAGRIDDATWRMEGLSDNYLRVAATAKRNLWNQISRVKIVNLTESGVEGDIVSK